MATSWSTKRRFVFGGSFVFFVVLLTGAVFWQIFYKAPTCTDGKKNGGETGIDCGGGCKNLCTSDALNPVVIWSKIFNISGDVYTAVAYIENPNFNSKNKNASYQFSIYDEKGNLITAKDGTTSIPKGKKFAVFQTGIVLKNSKPKTADFKFIKFGPWEKDITKEPVLGVKYGTLSSTSTIPRITGVISNDSLQNMPSLELAVFVLDGNENVVAASNTFIDNLNKRSSQDFVFTWPKPFNLGVENCVSPVDVVVALDRSGSMTSESKNPPEPFDTVKSTAENFIKSLTIKDMVSVISFGNTGRVESQISDAKDIAVSAIENLFLSTTTTENTNISDALVMAKNNFDAVKSSKSKKAIVLLTDGIPTEPVKSGNPRYPAELTIEASNALKNDGIEVYTIGLGKDIDEGFLKTISTDSAHYFHAPSKETLSSIYTVISKNLCPRKPNVINVIYRSLE